VLFARPLTLPSPARGEGKNDNGKDNRKNKNAKRVVSSPLAGEDAAKRQVRGLAKSKKRNA
jgi:hypothetical protein